MAYDSPRTIIVISILFELLTIIFVSFRFLARRQKRVPPMIADWLILATALCATGLTILAIYGISGPWSCQNSSRRLIQA